MVERRQAANGSQPAGSPLGLSAGLGTRPGFVHLVSPGRFPRLQYLLQIFLRRRAKWYPFEGEAERMCV